MTSKLAIRSPRTRAGRASAALLGLSAVAGLGLLAWLFLGRGVQPAQESDSTTPAPEDRPDLTPTSQAASSSALRAADPLPAEGNSRSASSQATPEPAPPPWKDFPVEITPAVRERLERFGETEDDYRRAQWAIAQTDLSRMSAVFASHGFVLEYGLKDAILAESMKRLKPYVDEGIDSERGEMIRRAIAKCMDELLENSGRHHRSVDYDAEREMSFRQIAEGRELLVRRWEEIEVDHKKIKETLYSEVENLLGLRRSELNLSFRITVR